MPLSLKDCHLFNEETNKRAKTCLEILALSWTHLNAHNKQLECWFNSMFKVIFMQNDRFSLKLSLDLTSSIFPSSWSCDWRVARSRKADVFYQAKLEGLYKNVFWSLISLLYVGCNLCTVFYFMLKMSEQGWGMTIRYIIYICRKLYTLQM